MNNNFFEELSVEDLERIAGGYSWFEFGRDVHLALRAVFTPSGDPLTDLPD